MSYVSMQCPMQLLHCSKQKNGSQQQSLLILFIQHPQRFYENPNPINSSRLNGKSSCHFLPFISCILSIYFQDCFCSVNGDLRWDPWDQNFLKNWNSSVLWGWKTGWRVQEEFKENLLLCESSWTLKDPTFPGVENRLCCDFLKFHFQETNRAYKCSRMSSFISILQLWLCMFSFLPNCAYFHRPFIIFPVPYSNLTVYTLVEQ